jgi:dolichol-phosphate mannosyltransferase
VDKASGTTSAEITVGHADPKASTGPDPFISIVTPAFNEEQNLPLLYERLRAVMETLAVEWEWIVVDDHSRDSTFALLTALAHRDPRVKGVRFARNFGSHTALAFGLQHAKGRCVTAIAGDLQDPPECIVELLEEWKKGAQVVWAARQAREGVGLATTLPARVYYWIMKNVARIHDMPANGADFFLVDRKVVDAFCAFPESNVSILALLSWMGFRQVTIDYDKKARIHGRSGWTLKKKLKLLVDSVTSFSYVPIRFMSYVGFLVAALGFVYAVIVIANSLRGRPVEGWASLMVVVLVIGGIQMLMMGVLGEYVWRSLDEARRRPRYIVEDTTSSSPRVVKEDSSPTLYRSTTST